MSAPTLSASVFSKSVRSEAVANVAGIPELEAVVTASLVFLAFVFYVLTVVTVTADWAPAMSLRVAACAATESRVASGGMLDIFTIVAGAALGDQWTTTSECRWRSILFYVICVVEIEGRAVDEPGQLNHDRVVVSACGLSFCNETLLQPNFCSGCRRLRQRVW